LCLLPSEAAGEAKPTKVPFELLKTDHIVVMVKINGKGPYRLIFDTGAPVTLLNSKIAKESGVLKNDGTAADMPVFDFEPLKIKTLQIGDLRAENLPTMVMDHPTVAAIDKLLGPVHGIIGLSFFGKYRFTIDYQAKEMTFTPVNFSPPNVTKAGGAVGFQRCQGRQGHGPWRHGQGSVAGQSRARGRLEGGRSVADARRPLDRFGGRLLRGRRLCAAGHGGAVDGGTRWQGNGTYRNGASRTVKQISCEHGGVDHVPQTFLFYSGRWIGLVQCMLVSGPRRCAR
jgi:hypothetical protein